MTNEKTTIKGEIYSLSDEIDFKIRNHKYENRFILSIKEEKTKNLIAIEYWNKDDEVIKTIYNSIKKIFYDYKYHDKKRPKIKAIIKGSLEDDVMKYEGLGIKLLDE